MVESGITCCLIERKQKCLRNASSAIFSKKLQELVAEKRDKLKIGIDKRAGHVKICLYHKNLILTHKPKEKKTPSTSKKSVDKNFDVDFNSLHVTALKRYKRHYKLPTRHNLNKSELVDAILKHFQAQPVSEMESVSLFVYTVKNGLNKLDIENLY
eukprot:Nk52_evm84s554 gene=Nk52_evmTU84s554